MQTTQPTYEAPAVAVLGTLYDLTLQGGYFLANAAASKPHKDCTGPGVSCGKGS